MKDFGWVIKKDDDWYLYNVSLDDAYSGIGLTSSGDPQLFAELMEYIKVNPDKLLFEHPLKEQTELKEELYRIKGWLESKQDTILDALVSGTTPATEEYSKLLEERTEKRTRQKEIEERLAEIS